MIGTVWGFFVVGGGGGGWLVGGCFLMFFWGGLTWPMVIDKIAALESG